MYNFVPKTVNLTLTLSSRESVKEMEEFIAKHNLKDESKALELAWKIACNIDKQYGIDTRDSENFQIYGLRKA